MNKAVTIFTVTLGSGVITLLNYRYKRIAKLGLLLLKMNLERRVSIQIYIQIKKCNTRLQISPQMVSNDDNGQHNGIYSKKKNAAIICTEIIQLLKELEPNFWLALSLVPENYSI